MYQQLFIILKIKVSGRLIWLLVDQSPEILYSMKRGDVSVMGRPGVYVSRAGQDMQVIPVDDHACIVPGGIVGLSLGDQAGELPVDHVL